MRGGGEPAGRAGVGDVHVIVLGRLVACDVGRASLLARISPGARSPGMKSRGTKPGQEVPGHEARARSPGQEVPGTVSLLTRMSVTIRNYEWINRHPPAPPSIDASSIRRSQLDPHLRRHRVLLLLDADVLWRLLLPRRLVDSRPVNKKKHK